MDRVASAALEALGQLRVNPSSLNYHKLIHVRIPIVPFWKVRHAADAVCEAVDRVASAALEPRDNLG